MYTWKLRGLLSVYEDARTLGLVLIGAGSLGLAGLGDLQALAGATATIAIGVGAWLLSVLRPIKVEDKQ